MRTDGDVALLLGSGVMKQGILFFWGVGAEGGGGVLDRHRTIINPHLLVFNL